ncbi:hypothetical protein G6L00_16365 [Agrobacterium rhizogenes]|nr:hypothetical protein [Rhizobium rhizogenes]
MSKKLKIVRRPVKCDVSRFMVIDSDICRDASWLESFAVLTFGADVTLRIHRPVSQGMKGDIEALAGDFRRVGAKLGDDKRRAMIAD